tara:strand:- start:375 stop:713 length:339 start_codon:yes stop_codon:yes gene_type:complete
MAKYTSFTSEDVATVKRVIGSEWMKSKELERGTGFNGAKIRAIANGSCTLVSNTQQGYRHVDYATVDEVQHSIADLRSRIAHMARRAGAMEIHVITKKFGSASPVLEQGSLL